MKFGKPISIMLAAMLFASPSIPIHAELNDTMILSKTVLTENGTIKTVYTNPDLLEVKKGKLKKAIELPESYSAIEEGLVTEVKNQYSGTCWAYGAMSAMETDQIKKGNADTSIDLSEKQLVYFSWNGADNFEDSSLYAGGDSFHNPLNNSIYEIGGNRYIASATLLRWYGAIKEDLLPFTTESTTPSDSYRTQSDIRLTDCLYLSEPNEGSSHDLAITEMKQAIYDYGSISISYSSSHDTKKSDSGTTYYCTDSTNDSDHTVTVVGWNDSIPASDFTASDGSSPSDNGGFLVKNSWGKNWGDNGYFYISYDDTSICEPTVYITEDQSSDQNHEYENIYQYDGVGSGDFAYFDTQSYVASNVFTARGDESTTAIGISTPVANSTVEYRIYEESNMNLLASGKQTISNAGAYTIDIDSVLLQKGSKYRISIQISFVSNGTTCYVYPFETMINNSDSLCTITSNSGESYISQSWGTTGTDTKDYDLAIGENISTGNALVKLYTTDKEEANTTDKEEANTTDKEEPKDISKEKVTFSLAKTSYTYDGKSKKPSVSAKGLVSGKDYTVSYKNNINVGTATVVITGKENYTGTRTLKFDIVPKGTSLSKLTKASKAFTVKWKKQTTQTTGYQIRYSKKKDMSSVKTVTISKNKTVSKKVTKLKKKTTYYVQVRTYKKVGSKNYYSAWSKTKSVKTK